MDLTTVRVPNKKVWKPERGREGGRDMTEGVFSTLPPGWRWWKHSSEDRGWGF